MYSTVLHLLPEPGLTAGSGSSRLMWINSVRSGLSMNLIPEMRGSLPLHSLAARSGLSASTILDIPPLSSPFLAPSPPLLEALSHVRHYTLSTMENLIITRTMADIFADVLYIPNSITSAELGV